MFDARIFLDTLDTARKILAEQKATFKGEYKIHDIIYAPRDTTKTLTDTFLRLRLVSLNIWDDKPVVVAIKNTELKALGKQSLIPLKQGFDTKEEALDFIAQNYLKDFVYSYEFDRIGWQYDLGDDQVDLEDIEGIFSIEFKSRTMEGLQKLTQLFNAQDIVKGPSVIAIKELLQR